MLRFPDTFPEIATNGFVLMPRSQRKPVAAYRRRLKRRGIVRVEVHVRKDDAALVRRVAQALSDPAREAEARSILRERFSPSKGMRFKALLAAAPLEGIDLTRERDLGRDAAL
jgi:plasmid stability protein